MKHHIIGPSKIPRIKECIGSLYGPNPDNSSSEAAREGTACHKLLEHCLSFGDDPRALLGSDLLDKEFPVNIEMVEAVELFIAEIRKVCDEHGIGYERIVSERRLVHPYVKEEMFGGTMDCQVWGDTTLIIADLKYGRRQVYADSPQLTAYSLLSLDSMEPVRQKSVTKIVQLIIQPRGNPQVDRYEPGSAEILELMQTVRAVEQYILANPNLLVRPPDLPLNAGDHCKYCPNRADCPARAAKVGELIQVGTFATGEPGKFLATPTSDVPTEDLVRWHEFGDVVKEFLTDVKKALTVRALQGHQIPGHKIVVGYGNRSFVEGPEIAAKKLPRAGLGLVKKDLFELKMLSVKQTEDLLKEKGVLKDKELKAKWESLIESTPTGVRLVSAKSRGEAVRPETAPEFLAALQSEKMTDDE